jgi:hypothetical protein
VGGSESCNTGDGRLKAFRIQDSYTNENDPNAEETLRLTANLACYLVRCMKSKTMMVAVQILVTIDELKVAHFCEGKRRRHERLGEKLWTRVMSAPYLDCAHHRICPQPPHNSSPVLFIFLTSPPTTSSRHAAPLPKEARERSSQSSLEAEPKACRPAAHPP